MPRPSILAARAQEMGMSINDMLRKALYREGSIEHAALALRVSPNSIQHWRKRNGYEVRVRCRAYLVRVRR